MAHLRPDSERLVGKMHCGVRDGGGRDMSAANLDWTPAGAVGEEVTDREREANGPQFANGQERAGDG
jgi:hypothetical protein